MVLRRKLKYEKTGDQGINLVDAQGRSMSVLGVAKFFVLPRNKKKRRLLRALVSGDLEGEPLIGWQQMQQWGLLSRSFLDIVDEESEEEGMALLGDPAGDTVKAVRGSHKTVEVDVSDVGITEKVEILKKQMEDQRKCQDFLNLEES